MKLEVRITYSVIVESSNMDIEDMVKHAIESVPAHTNMYSGSANKGSSSVKFDSHLKTKHKIIGW